MNVVNIADAISKFYRDKISNKVAYYNAYYYKGEYLFSIPYNSIQDAEQYSAYHNRVEIEFKRSNAFNPYTYWNGRKYTANAEENKVVYLGSFLANSPQSNTQNSWRK